MKLAKYRVTRLNEPEGNITHQLVYETISKNKDSGGYGLGIRYRGSYKECIERKREIEEKKEIWQNIKGYEGLYQVSNMGRIKRLPKTEYVYNYLSNTKVKRVKKEKILAYKRNSNNYIIVTLSNNGVSKAYTIHRLVAQTFIPNPNNYPQINHINGKKYDNRVENLEWCTASENIKHASRVGLRKTTKKQKTQAKRNLKKANEAKKRKIYQLTKDNKIIKVWDSMSDIFRELHFYWGNIGSVCRKEKELAYGYKWEYKEKKDVSKSKNDNT